MLRLVDLNAIAHLVSVRNASRVLAFVVVADHTLPPFFEVLPVCLKADIVDGIASKYQLHRCSAHGGVQSCSHRETNSTQDSLPCTRVQILFGLDTLCSDHVRDRLVCALDHRVGLRIARGDDSASCDKCSPNAV